MFNLKKHRTFLIRILKSIYADPELRTVLGFKGGTAVMLFYNLNRMSVDLDFDLLQEDKKGLVFEKIKKILEQYGSIYDAAEKRYTFKVEISKRKGISAYELKSYLGISMLVMKPADMAAGKLAALLTRKKFAMRDVYDIWFYLNNDWPINEAVLIEKTGLTVRRGLKQAVKKISGLKSNQLLQGLGDLLDNKTKHWVKENLVKDAIFQLKLRLENL